MEKNPPANAGDTGSVPGSRRSPGEGMAAHTSIFAWEIPRTEGWWATVHGVTKESDMTQQLNNKKKNAGKESCFQWLFNYRSSAVHRSP